MLPLVQRLIVINAEFYLAELVDFADNFLTKTRKRFTQSSLRSTQR
jgi:hypothetical protein